MSIKRDDSSGYLCHWIKANPYTECIDDNFESAYETLLEIIGSKEIKSGNPRLTNGYDCVCLSESLPRSVLNGKAKYQPFGIRFVKNSIYRMGGRHVIYLDCVQAMSLGKSLEWLHVEHDPHKKGTPYGIDFTWEREWRVQTDSIYLPYIDFWVMVPNEYYRDRLCRELDGWIFNAQKQANEDARYINAAENYIDELDSIKDNISII
ncbi:hypothetical protein [Providencia rettgeri]|uniref:hypothetical protein n=1 Tax=Providencia rettgeri TaxID=587 RepID=UPI0018C5A8C9|nr:hypothetical protein [Providencia rettgeri]MBG5923162.1 hypothetical protein [Providencia rettgeri]